MAEKTTWTCDFPNCNKRIVEWSKKCGWLRMDLERFSIKKTYHLCKKHADSFIEELTDPMENLMTLSE